VLELLELLEVGRSFGGHLNAIAGVLSTPIASAVAIADLIIKGPLMNHTSGLAALMTVQTV
jgi:hypothetical protein